MAGQRTGEQHANRECGRSVLYGGSQVSQGLSAQLAWGGRVDWKMLDISSLCAYNRGAYVKKLFVLGDSISIHYGPFLRDMVRDVFEYARKQTTGVGLADGSPADANGGDSALVLAFLRKYLSVASPDVLLLNCGLHDLRTDPETRQKQVPPEVYQANLKEILQLVPRGMRLVWMRTTPVDDETHNSRAVGFQRFGSDVMQYNEVADRLFEAAGVPTIDLYGFTCGLGGGLFCDHVHFTERVRALQAAFIAGHLLAWS